MTATLHDRDSFENEKEGEAESDRLMSMTDSAENHDSTLPEARLNERTKERFE